RRAARVAARRGSEGGPATGPERGADAARARPAGALLPPRLLPAAAHEALRLRRGRTGAAAGELALDRSVEEVLAHRARDHRGRHLDLADLLPALRHNRDRHGSIRHHFPPSSRLAPGARPTSTVPLSTSPTAP